MKRRKKVLQGLGGGLHIGMLKCLSKSLGVSSVTLGEYFLTFYLYIKSTWQKVC